MFSGKMFVEKLDPSVRNRMVEYFFNRLTHHDLDCLRMPDHNRGLDAAESPVNTSRLLGTDLSHLLNNRELDAIFARRSQPNVPGSRAGHTGDRGRVLTAFERQVLGARVQETSVPNRAIRYLAGPQLCEQGQRYLAAKLHRR
jgi:hypothetical protein